MPTDRSIEIRPLRPADEPEWRRMWAGYLTFYDSAVPDDVYDVYFQRLLGDNPRDFSGLIARVDGQPRGLAHYLFHRHGWSIADTCYLQDLWVDDAARGTGLGRALIEAVYAGADAHGAGSTYWLTQDFNQTARRLYDRIGTLTPFIRYNRS